MAKRRCFIQLRKIAKHLADGKRIFAIPQGVSAALNFARQGGLRVSVCRVSRRRSCLVLIWHGACCVEHGEWLPVRLKTKIADPCQGEVMMKSCLAIASRSSLWLGRQLLRVNLRRSLGDDA
jgi:hypothetical protein